MSQISHRTTDSSQKEASGLSSLIVNKQKQNLSILEQKKYSLENTRLEELSQEEQLKQFMQRKYSQITDNALTEQSMTPVYSHYQPLYQNNPPFYFHKSSEQSSAQLSCHRQDSNEDISSRNRQPNQFVYHQSFPIFTQQDYILPSNQLANSFHSNNSDHSLIGSSQTQKQAQSTLTDPSPRNSFTYPLQQTATYQVQSCSQPQFIAADCLSQSSHGVQSVISQSLPCQCTNCLQAQMAYLQQLLIQQQNLYIQQTMMDQMNESMLSQNSHKSQQKMQNSTTSLYSYPAPPNLEGQRMTRQQTVVQSVKDDSISNNHKQLNINQSKEDLQKYYESYIQQEISESSEQSSQKESADSCQELTNQQLNQQRKNYFELPLGEIPEMKESFYEDQSRYTNSSLSKKFASTHFPNNPYNEYHSLQNRSTAKKSSHHERLNSKTYKTQELLSLERSKLELNQSMPFNDESLIARTLPFHSKTNSMISNQSIQYSQNQTNSFDSQPYCQYGNLITPYKQRQLSGSNWGTSILKDQSQSCQLGQNTTQTQHRRDVSQVSNWYGAIGNAENVIVKENINPHEVSPFPNSICSSINQQVSNLNTEINEYFPETFENCDKIDIKELDKCQQQVIMAMKQSLQQQQESSDRRQSGISFNSQILDQSKRASFYQDKTERVINYILDQETSQNRQTSNSRKRPAIIEQQLKHRHTIGPSEISRYDNSLKKCQSVYRSLEKKTKQDDKIILERVLPFPIEDIMHYNDLDTQQHSVEQPSTHNFTISQEEAFRCRSVEPKNGRAFQKYNPLQTVSQALKRQSQACKSDRDVISMASSSRWSSVPSQKAPRLALRSTSNQIPRVKPGQPLQIQKIVAPLPQNPRLGQEQSKKKVINSRGQKNLQKQPRQQSQNRRITQNLAQKDASSKNETIFQKLANSNYKSRKTRIELSLKNQDKQLYQNRTVSRPKCTKTHKFQKNLFEMSELPSLANIQRSVSAQRQQNQLISSINARKQSIQSQESQKNIIQQLIRTSLRQKSINSSNEKSSTLRTFPKEKKNLRSQSYQPISQKERQQQANKNKQLNKAQQSYYGKTQRQTRNFSDNKISVRDSIVNIKTHARTDSNEHQRTRINTQSPSFYNSDFSFKQRQQNSSRATSVNTPVQIMISDENLVQQPSSLIVDRQSSQIKNPFQNSNLTSYRESLVVSTNKEVTPSRTLIGSFGKSGISSQYKASMFQHIIPYQTEDEEFDNQRKSPNEIEHLIESQIDKPNFDEVKVSQNCNLQQRISDYYKIKDQNVIEDKKSKKPPKDSFTYNQDSKAITNKDLSLILYQLNSTHRSRQSTQQNLSSFNTIDQQEFLSFNSQKGSQREPYYNSNTSDKKDIYHKQTISSSRNGAFKQQDSSINLVSTPLSKECSLNTEIQRSQTNPHHTKNNQTAKSHVREVYSSPTLEKQPTNINMEKQSFVLPNVLFFNHSRATSDLSNQTLRNQQMALKKNYQHQRISTDIDVLRQSSDQSPSLNNVLTSTEKSLIVQKTENSIIIRSFGVDQINQSSYDHGQTANSNKPQLKIPKYKKQNESIMKQTPSRMTSSSYNNQWSSASRRQDSDSKNTSRQSERVQFRTLKLSSDEKQSLKERVEEHRRHSLNRTYNQQNI